ncbi:MAG: peptidase U32 family protein [Bacillota bacterium]
MREIRMLRLTRRGLETGCTVPRQTSTLPVRGVDGLLTFNTSLKSEVEVERLLDNEMEMPKKSPELLAPAGDLEKLKIAFHFGADAVYLAGKKFGLRASANNFSTQEMAEGIALAHRLGKRVYVAVNIYAHNRDIEDMPNYLAELSSLGADGLIVSDPGIIRLVLENAPGLPLHLSTQANTTNWSSALFWATVGVKRLVLARELTLSEIAEISTKVDIELEGFVHGAMCIAYSGRCLLSNYFTGRSANKGECTHPCRWRYHLMEQTRPGVFLPIEEDDRGTYVMSSKDLCMLEHILALVNSGLMSFKIEGRMKSIHYVATVINAYRHAIDNFMINSAYIIDQWLLEEVKKAGTRGFSTGFYFGQPSFEAQELEKSARDTEAEFVGIVKESQPEKERVIVEQRNHFAIGDLLEVLEPRKRPWRLTLEYMEDLSGSPIEKAPHPQQLVIIRHSGVIPPNALIRKLSK